MSEKDELITTFKKLPPLEVSLRELMAILILTFPFIMQDKWAMSTIKDLWTCGAPTPASTIHNEKRIIFPGKLAEWIEDILTRYGRPLDETAKIYNKLQDSSRWTNQTTTLLRK